MHANSSHSHRVCPVWLGHLLASPIRALFHNPRKILGPFVKPGMRVMDIGPAMGFFSLPMARMVGPGGRVVCVDVQQKMLDALMRRARKAKLDDRIEPRLAGEDTLGTADLAGTIDFVLAFFVVHEVGDPKRLFEEVQSLLKPEGRVLFVEPPGHVPREAFEASVKAAEESGLRRAAAPNIRRTHAVVLEKI